jgi:hypothetical protein
MVQNLKSEIRIPKEFRIPNSESQKPLNSMATVGLMDTLALPLPLNGVNAKATPNKPAVKISLVLPYSDFGFKGLAGARPSPSPFTTPPANPLLL